MPSRARAAGGFSLFGLRPTPLTATIGVASIAAAANMAAAVAAPDAAPAPQTRLGASIEQSVQDRNQSLANQRRGAGAARAAPALAAEQRLKADLAGASARTGSRFRPAASPARTARRMFSEPSQYDDLARICQTMKPQRAAPVFERLDLDVQTEVARRMRERSTALIMSSMSPAAARAAQHGAGRPAGRDPSARAGRCRGARTGCSGPRARARPRRPCPCGMRRARRAGRLSARPVAAAGGGVAPAAVAPAAQAEGAADGIKPVPPKV